MLLIRQSASVRLLFLESILLIEKRRVKIAASFNGTPFAFEIPPVKRKTGDDTVERCFYETADFAFAAHDHAEHACHDTADRDGLVFGAEIRCDGVSVF